MTNLSFLSMADELSVRADGTGFVTIRGAARLAGVSDTALRVGFQSANLEPSRMAKKLMESGFEAAELSGFSANGIPDEALAVILEYYALDAGIHCKEQAKHVYRSFAKVGIRSVIWKVKGFELPSAPQIKPEPQPSIPMTQAQALLASVQIIADIEQKQIQQEARLAIAEHESQVLRQQLADIQQIQLAAQEELMALPPSARDVPQESTDMKIRRLVNNYCAATGGVQREVWGTLYQQFNLRYHRIIKPMDGESKLQCFIRMGLIETLYALAVDMLASKTALQIVR